MFKNNFLKVLSMSLICSSTAFAAAFTPTTTLPKSGFYMGLQLGYANLHYDKSWLYEEPEVESIGSVTSSGVAGRLYVGYKFMPYFGMELGFLGLPEVKFNDVYVTDGWDIYGPASVKFDQSIVDLFVKGIIPIKNKVEFYGKAGIAGVDRRVSGDDDNYDDKSVAALGIGAAYYFNRHLFADVSYTRYFGDGDLEATDLITGGIGYQFE